MLSATRPVAHPPPQPIPLRVARAERSGLSTPGMPHIPGTTRTAPVPADPETGQPQIAVLEAPVIATPCVYDATRPTETHTLGPGRHSHAYPADSHVALCGHTRGPDPMPGVSPHCPVCTREAGRRNWATR